MPTQINGLPAHVLLIHLVLAAVPLAALLVVLHAIWPAARRRLGIVTPIVAAVALVFVPITTNAGEWLEDHIHVSGEIAEKVERHADLGGTLIWFAIPLFVVAAALWVLGRRYDYGLLPDNGTSNGSTGDASDATSGSTMTAVRTQPRASLRATLPMWANAVIALVAVAIAVINVVQLYRIGDAGAQSVWGN